MALVDQPAEQIAPAHVARIRRRDHVGHH
jgi:hypothetical protein